MSETSDVLDRRWRGACKAVLREEVGDLADFAPWLSEDIDPIGRNKSTASGKEVICGPTDYAAGAKWLSFEEVDFDRKFSPLSINEIKDIDSLLGAIDERMHYSGNIFFGNSGHIENSSNVNDSFYIYESARHGNSKYIAYCTQGRLNEDCFGCGTTGESAYCIKCYRCYRNKRAFELWMSQNCADCHYSYGLENCSECMFCFNAASRRRAIGNLALEGGKFEALRGKLLSEIVQELSRKKRLPSLLGIVGKGLKEKLGVRLDVPAGPERTDKVKIEAAFEKTSSLVFGKKLEGGVDAYSKWLSRHTRLILRCFSAASGREMMLANYSNYPRLPRNRLLSLAEAKLFGEKVRLGEKEAEALTLANAHEKLDRLAFFNIEMVEGNNRNNAECAVCVDSSDCYRSSAVVYSKCCAYSFWPRSCEHLFGCDSPFDSAFSINCYSCTQLTRCFEIDCCGYCSDAYFCHNCENLHDAMFCFNVKNRRFSIGNAELPPDKYKSVKGMLLSQMADELQNKKDLKWDIYNVACRK